MSDEKRNPVWPVWPAWPGGPVVDPRVYEYDAPAPQVYLNIPVPYDGDSPPLDVTDDHLTAIAQSLTDADRLRLYRLLHAMGCRV